MFTEAEEKLIKTARKEILKHVSTREDAGLFDVLYAFVLSESGEIYVGKPFMSNQPSFNFCAERHAINEMQYAETEEATIKAVLVAGPVPKNKKEHKSTPCGACRHTINEFGNDNTTVMVSNFVREGDGNWEIFPSIDKFRAADLYPEPHEPVVWDED